MGARSVGVEEELLLVDPDTGRTKAVADRALRHHAEPGAGPGSGPGAGPGSGPGAGDAGEDARVEAELFREQIETMTAPCTVLDGSEGLREELAAGRRTVCRIAEEAGARAVAAPTPVLSQGEPEPDHVTNQDRYRRMRDEFGELARTTLVCGMHVHVGVTDAEEGVRVIDGIRPWLPVVLAVSANSPFHLGRDTGYASWRTQVWTRWPTAGTGEPFGSPDAYDRVRDRLIVWGAGFDDGMVYFDARLSAKLPTVEVRVADVCTDLDDAVLVAALARALVTTAATPRPAGTPSGWGEAGWRSELLRAATWRAARYGLADRLVHPERMELAGAREVLQALITHTRPALEDTGDLDRVRDLVEQLLARGTGATRQRRVFEIRGDLDAVVEDLVSRTRG
jgi:carboxylate-amine ligase